MKGGRQRPEAERWYRFSAFWLRSSVVSVLISLISDTFSTREQHIKWIFGAGSWSRSLLCPLCASTWYCSVSRPGACPSGGNNWCLKSKSSVVSLATRCFSEAFSLSVAQYLFLLNSVIKYVRLFLLEACSYEIAGICERKSSWSA